MKQDTVELLAGGIYGIVKGVVKTVAPGSQGAFNYMDECIKNASAAATAMHPIGEAIGKGLLGILLAL